MNEVAPRRRVLVFAALTVIVALIAVWLFVLRAGNAIQTDLLAMLPATERNPLAEVAVQRLTHDNGDRVVLLLEGDDDEAVKQAASNLGKDLSASQAFASVIAELPAFDLNAVLTPYLSHRFHLLSSADRETLEAGSIDVRQLLARHLGEPFAVSVGVALQDDPFGWLQHWIDRQPWAASPLLPEDDLLTAHEGDTTSVLVLANLRGSAYDDEVQRVALSALAQAESRLQQDFPSVKLLRTGAMFYAARARADAERDVHVVGIASTTGIALLLLWAFRSARPLLLAFVSTAFGVLCAMTVTLALFGQLYLLTLVFGAALLGEAVDYSIQYLCARANAGSDWQPLRGLRQVRPALLLALTTSLLGYALLGGMPFPPLRQMACFAIVGMSAACLSVFWLLPALTITPATRPLSPSLVAFARRMQQTIAALAHGRQALVSVIVLLLLAVPGWWRLSHDDDIHLLINPPPALQAQEARIRDVTGIGNGSQFFLVHGENAEQVLQREEALAARLQTLVDEGSLTAWTGVAAMVPSLQRQQADHALLEALFADRENLRTNMLAAGLRASVVDAWLAAWPGTPLSIEEWLKLPVAVPYRMLWMDDVQQGAASQGAASIVLVQGQRDNEVLREVAAALQGVELVDKPESISTLFGRYRTLSSLWLTAAVALVALVFVWRYRRDALRVLAPSALGIGLSLSALGLLGQPLTLFHWLALMLVLGVGANYAVFLYEGEPHAQHLPGAAYAGVLLSALTAWLSFGLLALSSLPALQHFGLTLLLGIGFTVVLVPVVAFRARAIHSASGAVSSAT